MKFLEKTIVLLALLFFCSLSYAVFETARENYTLSLKERNTTIEREGYQPPTIPECDAPLWERVKDRCNG